MSVLNDAEQILNDVFKRCIETMKAGEYTMGTLDFVMKYQTLKTIQNVEQILIQDSVKRAINQDFEDEEDEEEYQCSYCVHCGWKMINEVKTPTLKKCRGCSKMVLLKPH